MSNMCFNKVMFTSKDFKVLDVFRKELFYLVKNNTYYNLHSLFKDKGIDNLTFCSGDLYYVQDELYYNDNLDEYHFFIETETKWEPQMEYWIKLLDKYYSNIIFCFNISTEANGGIFENNDRYREYFKDNYFVDVCNYKNEFECELFETLEECYRFVCKYMNWKFTNIKKLKRKFKKLSKKTSNNFYCRIEEYYCIL